MKKCLFCKTEFQDNTKSKNKKFCSINCREKNRNLTQKRKMYKHRFYLNRIKFTRYFFRNTPLGTLSDSELNKRIELLLRCC